VPLLLSLLLCLFLAKVRGSAPTPVPIVFHVAESAEHRAPIEPFLMNQVRRANEAFAPTGVAFEDRGHVPLAAVHAVLVTRADRDQLLPYAKAGAVHCMVVARLMDVDEPGRERRGVHWYRAGTSRPHVVILSTLAGDYVLAHELGHFFGNPQHSQEPGNLMSYLPGVLPPFLTEPQKARVRASLARMTARGELPPL
jgi:hypothetical protein